MGRWMNLLSTTRYQDANELLFSQQPMRLYVPFLYLLAIVLSLIFGLVACADQPEDDGSTLSGESQLQRMLKLVPDRPEYREGGVYFSDYERSKRVKNLGTVDSSKKFQQLSRGKKEEFVQAMRIPVPSPFLGLDASKVGGWRDTFGFDYYQVKRDILAGRPTDWFDVIEGSFNTKALGKTLTNAGYNEGQLRGSVLYSFGSEDGIDIQSRVWELALSRMNRVAVLNSGTIGVSPKTELLGEVVDAYRGPGKSLADDPAYAAMVKEMGDPLGAILSSGLEFARFPPSQNDDPEEVVSSLARPTLVGVAYSDDGKERRIIVAKYFAGAGDAAVELPALEARLRELVNPNFPLRVAEMWEIVDPRALSAASGSLAVVELLLKPEVSGDIWFLLYNASGNCHAEG